MMIHYYVLLIIALIYQVYGSDRVNVVLMGATGNLAEKYLWQGLYNIHNSGLQNANDEIFVYPAATKKAKDNAPILDRILKNSITWKGGGNSKDNFLARVNSYVQLRDASDYENLGKLIESQQEAANENEIGRLVYLSVPPKFFGSISALINQYLRPKNKNAWLRVIVEKPFGVDLNSAKDLANEMYQSLSNDEILLIDHYMGKVGMHSIRHFVQSHDWKEFLGNRKVAKVEAAMLETDDCKGRTGFYDEVGVIRDTLQNHVTQMLAVLTMNPEGSLTDEPTARKDVLRKLSKAFLSRVLKLGQYSTYNSHVNEDRERWGEKPLENPSKTVTYAHLVLTMKDSDSVFDNVPLHLVSGKALDARRSYVEVELDDGDVLLFNFQGKKGEASEAAVLLSGTSTTTMSKLPGWTETKTPTGLMLQAPESPFAYEILLRAGLEGHKEHFVRLDEVLQSWEIWSPLLEDLEKNPPVLESYGHGSDLLSDTAAKKHDEL